MLLLKEPTAAMISANKKSHHMMRQHNMTLVQTADSSDAA